MPSSFSDGKYLGLPYLIGRSKREIFTYLKDSIWRKAHGWKEQVLSRGENEILIKAMLQSIPTFAMSVFKLPLRICFEIQVICRKFWWKSVGEERGTAWIAWDTMCRPKRNGGMGLKNISLFNQALLMKQAWQLLQFPHSLVSRVLKAKYFHNQDFLQVHMGQFPSYIWRFILHSRALLIKGIRWRIRMTLIYGCFMIHGYRLLVLLRLLPLTIFI